MRNLLGGALAAVLIAAASCSLPASAGTPITTTAGGEGPYRVASVVDGDTVKVDIAGHKTTVRLIGLDSPETRDPRKPVQCFGREASRRAHELQDGQRVWLEFDPTQRRQDRYGRLLAYVRLSDGTLVNQVLIQDGFAHEYTYDAPYRYQREFQADERAARDAGRGLWSPATCAGDTEQAAHD